MHVFARPKIAKMCASYRVVLYARLLPVSTATFHSIGGRRKFAYKLIFKTFMTIFTNPKRFQFLLLIFNIFFSFLHFRFFPQIWGEGHISQPILFGR
jgi:hypothetical protein